MQTYSLFDKPLKVSGIPFFEKDKRLARLSDDLIAQLPHLDHLGRRCAGARVAFKSTPLSSPLSIFALNCERSEQPERDNISGTLA